MNDIKDYLLNEIEETENKTYENQDLIQYTCLFCGSGNGKNKSGAFTYYHKTKSFYCHSCGIGGDIGDYFENKYNLPFGSGLKEASKKYLNAGIEPIKKKRNDSKITMTAKERLQFSKSNKVESDYFSKRGFSEKTIQDFNLYTFKNEYGYINAMIPNTENHLIERGLNGKFKASFGKVEIFNLNDLYNQDKRAVFIVEGWADCLSFYECGFYSIALNSTSNKNLLIKQLTDKPTSNKLILALDNDSEGKKTSQELKEKLKVLGYETMNFDLKNYKDSNEFLLADRNDFIDTAKEIENKILLPGADGEATDQEYFINDIDQILDEIKTDKYKPLDTGLKTVNKILGGGLYSGLTVIGAESQMGKSTLIQNICENIAKTGKPVIYFSLEMSKSQLLFRGLSKQSFLLSGKKSGYSSADFRNANVIDVKKYADSYKEIARNLIVKENHKGTTADEIYIYVDNYINQTGLKPVVIVDYLQYIHDDGNNRATEKQQIDFATMKLKALSIKHDLIVIAISSLNRKSYGGLVDMDSFSGSGKVEYTADFILGLSLAESRHKQLSKDETDQELQKQPRNMILQVLKGRDIENRNTAELQYYSKYNYFTDLPTDFQDTKKSKKNNDLPDFFGT